LCFTAVVVLGFAGCGKREPPTGEVSGTVTYKGKPLPEGMITFFNADEGRSGQAAIKDGEYECPNAPVGPCGVEVSVNIAREAGANAPDMSKRMKAMMAKAKGMGADVPEDAPTELKAEHSSAIPIPRRYANYKTSGLTCTVEQGKQTLNVPLQP
jgi:hypothetical protein